MRTNTVVNNDINYGSIPFRFKRVRFLLLFKCKGRSHILHFPLQPREVVFSDFIFSVLIPRTHFLCFLAVF